MSWVTNIITKKCPILDRIEPGSREENEMRTCCRQVTMVTVAHASLVALQSEVENGEGVSEAAALYATLCKEGFPPHLVVRVP